MHRDLSEASIYILQEHLNFQRNRGIFICTKHSIMILIDLHHMTINKGLMIFDLCNNERG